MFLDWADFSDLSKFTDFWNCLDFGDLVFVYGFSDLSISFWICWGLPILGGVPTFHGF